MVRLGRKPEGRFRESLQLSTNLNYCTHNKAVNDSMSKEKYNILSTHKEHRLKNLLSAICLFKKNHNDGIRL